MRFGGGIGVIVVLLFCCFVIISLYFIIRFRNHQFLLFVIIFLYSHGLELKLFIVIPEFIVRMLNLCVFSGFLLAHQEACAPPAAFFGCL